MEDQVSRPVALRIPADGNNAGDGNTLKWSNGTHPVPNGHERASAADTHDLLGQQMDQRIDHSERIAVVGSPSSTTELSLDILGSAVGKKLIGELALLRFQQDTEPHYALGQITEITLRNVWHEDPTMRSLIRQRGRVDAVSERQDTHQGEMGISAVFARAAGGYSPSRLGTVPPTGTPIHLVDDTVLHHLLAPFQRQLFYLGKAYGSSPLMPLWFKHFDRGEQGAGEAYHLGIFGKTGSGKSVLAKMILLAYARHPNMALLVIDPQGEFAKEVRGESVPGQFDLPTKQVLNRLRKPARVVGVRDIVLDRWDLFEQIFARTEFLDRLGVRAAQNRRVGVEILRERLQKAGVKLRSLATPETFSLVWDLLGDSKIQEQIYVAKDGRERLQRRHEEADPEEFYQRYWQPMAELFRANRPEAKEVDFLLDRLFSVDNGVRPLLVIDLSLEQSSGSGKDGVSLFQGGEDSEDSTESSPQLLWDETIQALVIKRLLEGIRYKAEQAYRKNQSLNTLVLIDEAHRIAPREEPDNDDMKGVRSILVDAARTTRKYGVGWMFISQTLSSLHREIIEQMRIFFFGFGLGMGSEFAALSNLVGGRSKALDLYQLFRDPHSSFDVASREYSFMTIGPVSPLSFAGTPLFLNIFNDPQEFLARNGWR